MKESQCDVLIVGGGTGGVAAALSATSLGLNVVLTEPTDWVGGQLTSQAVPPDEHPWIEQFGCTARYRAYRDGVRAYYRDHTPLTASARNNPRLNPGGGWVSRLCHEPRIGHSVLKQMLQPALASGRLDLRLMRVPVSADASGDEVQSVSFINQLTGREETVHAKYVLDATELGDLLPLTLTEYVSGAESKRDTEEPNAIDGPAEPDNVQGLTWCYALAYDEGSHREIDQPASYERWKSYWPVFWPGPLLGFDVLHAHTGEPRKLPLFSDNWYALFPYRQIVQPDLFEPGYAPHPVTIVNWPQNDYFEHSIIDVEESVAEARLQDSKQLGLSLLYWLQTEAPRHDGGVGYPGLYLRPDIMGTEDGFAKAPYIREARRISAAFTVLEQHVAAYTNPGRDRAIEFKDSVGIGAYRIDLHPSTSGANTIDTSTLPFQIPLKSLIPIRMRNLIASGKCIGVTHITNGCYRLHPVEWNVGEAAGLLAGFCLLHRVEPSKVAENTELLEAFQRLLVEQGIELDWPRLRAL
jgi:hypothetical protein